MAAAQPIVSSQEGARIREDGSTTAPAAGGNQEAIASSVGAGTASLAVGGPPAFGSGGRAAAGGGVGMSTVVPSKDGSTSEGRYQDKTTAGETIGEASSSAAPSGGGFGSNSLGNGDDIDDEDLLII